MYLFSTRHTDSRSRAHALGFPIHAPLCAGMGRVREQAGGTFVLVFLKTAQYLLNCLSQGCCLSVHACAPVPLQSKICKRAPLAVEAPGTSRHRPLPRPTNLNMPLPRETGCHCWL